MNIKRFYGIAFAVWLLSFLMPSTAFSRAKIPVGTRDVIEVVHIIPAKDSVEIDGKRLHLARFHKEFNIAYILPLWIEEEPRLVFYDPESESYYDTTTPQAKAFLESYLKEKGLKETELLNPGFYTRYGGKAVLAIIVALMIWGAIPSKKKDKIKPVKL